MNALVVCGASKKVKSPSTSSRELWLGYNTMNTIAQIKKNPKVPLRSIEELVEYGLRPKETKESFESLPSFPFVLQEQWPSVRPDGKGRNHFNLTQLPSEVKVDFHGYAKDYQVAIHFEMGPQLWTRKVIMTMVEQRLKAMNISLRDKIGEPFALTFFHQSDNWNSTIRLSLQNPDVDIPGLLKGLRSFILILGEGIPHLGKVCKTYDAIAYSHLMNVKISGPNLAKHEWALMHEEIVRESFLRGFEFEITSVEKKPFSGFAFIKTPSPRQALKVKDSKVSLSMKSICQSLPLGKCQKVRLPEKIVSS